MSLFFILLLKDFSFICEYIARLYFNKIFEVSQEKQSQIYLFISLGPIVVFSATISVKIDMAILFLPIFFYVLSSIIGIFYYYICIQK